MRCFSLISQRLALPNGDWSRAYLREDPYPVPTPGIALRPSDRALFVGWKDLITSTPELLRLAPESGAIERNGDQVKILRCSVTKTENGQWRFVPETAEDADEALVYLDISAGRHLNLRFDVKPEQIVSRVRVDGSGVVDEKLLVRLRPFGDPVVAYRSDLRFWFFGEERVREVLTIQFDGQNIFYNHKRVD